MSTEPFVWPKDSQTGRALEIYQVSSSRVPLAFYDAVLTIKLAACECNATLGYLDPAKAREIRGAVEWLRRPGDSDKPRDTGTFAPAGPFQPAQPRMARFFCLDAWQGGAGTSINMNVNEAIAWVAGNELGCPLDPLLDVNLHQSTNDVLPSALRLMLLDRLQGLEQKVTRLQGACQNREQAWSGCLMPGHTQLQDAIVMDAGKIGSTWAGCLGRDRWRIFKGRERLKELNLGGTAIGSGAGAPRDYVLGVVRSLQKLTLHPVTRSEDLFEATSNFDGVTEAMEALNILAQDLNRMATDIRLLSSGPSSGMGFLRLPAWLKGSSIMPGKVNPVMAELVLQVAQRVMANHALLVRTCASSELQLNAFFPLILQTCHENLEVLEGCLEGFSCYVEELELDRLACARALEKGSVYSLVLVPLVGYHCVEALIIQGRAQGRGLREELEQCRILPEELMEILSQPRLAVSQGYDPALYRDLAQRFAAPIQKLKTHYGATE